MKRKIERVIAAVCAAAAVLSIAGCNQKAADGDMKKVTIWTGDSHSKSAMNELVAEFNKTKGKELGVEIEYTVKEGNYTQTIEMAIASQQEPYMYKTWSTQQYYETGDIVALDEIEGGKEYLASFPQELTERFKSKVNGHTFTVPYYVNTFGVAYNADMLKKYGLTDENGEARPPETFDELREYAKKMTNEAEGEYGMIFPLKESTFYQNILKMSFASAGTAGYNHAEGVYEYEKVLPALQCLIDIKNDKSIYPGAEGLDNDTARALFAEGKIGMIFSGSYDVAVFTAQFPAKCDWSVAPMPVENKDVKYLQKMAGDGGLAMNKEMYETLGAEKALAVYGWYHSDETLRELYRRGCVIPENPEIIKDVKPNEGIVSAWEKFGKLGDISYVERSNMPTDLEGTPDFKTCFQTKLWVQEGNAEEILKDLSARSNAGVDKKLSANTSLKRENYISKDFDVRR